MTIKIQRLLARAKKLTKKGDVKKAREIYSSVLKSFPDNQEAKKGFLINQLKETHPNQMQLDNLMKLYSSGQIDDALSCVNLLLSDYPNDPLLFNIKGACFSAAGSIKSAILDFEKAINLKSDYTEAHYNLGVAFQSINQLSKAKESYQKAISLKHAYPNAHNNLGLIFLRHSQLDSAVKSFEWAIAYNPEYAEAINNLGATFQELKQFMKAKSQFEKAIVLNPNYEQAFHNLGVLCEIINLPDKALNYYEKAVSINPEFAEAYRNLSKIKKFKIGDPQILQIQSIYSKTDINPSDKVKLSFALAEVYKDLEDHNKFFKFLHEGNKLRKKELNYSLNESKEFHSIIINLFNTAQPIIKESSSYSSNIKPIFIVGMPRSGTSLVEQIIASHHSVYGAGELLSLRKIISPILDNNLNKNKASLAETDLLTIRKQYLESLENLGTTEKIITDKMPMNFRLIGFILSSMPEAKIIHLKRDARATCWSNYNHYFTSGNGFTFNQEDLSKFYGFYSEIMDFWHQLFPNKIHDISYEKLTINQKSETQKLLKYCELEWDEDCLDFHKNKRGVVTASSSQVRQKMYQGSSEAWKKYETYIQPLINGLKSY